MIIASMVERVDSSVQPQDPSGWLTRSLELYAENSMVVGVGMICWTKKSDGLPGGDRLVAGRGEGANDVEMYNARVWILKSVRL